MTNHTIGAYKLFYYTKRAYEYANIAMIFLYNEQDQNIGFISFYKEGETVPDNSQEINKTPTRVLLRCSDNQLDRIVDMLRNEKPCSVFYSSPTNAYVYTGKEPIGEEETEGE